jgi:hypothetical protein
MGIGIERNTAIALGLAVAALAGAAYHVFGQSPAARARATLNGRPLEIRYSAPSVRGRRINSWELIVNRETGQWGLSYDAARDLGRVRMTMSKPVAPVELLKYTIHDHGGGKGELRLEWENRAGSVPLTMRE